jgi:hypothetical protein
VTTALVLVAGLCGRLIVISPLLGARLRFAAILRSLAGPMGWLRRGAAGEGKACAVKPPLYARMEKSLELALRSAASRGLAGTRTLGFTEAVGFAPPAEGSRSVVRPFAPAPASHPSSREAGRVSTGAAGDVGEAAGGVRGGSGRREPRGLPLLWGWLRPSLLGARPAPGSTVCSVLHSST